MAKVKGKHGFRFIKELGGAIRRETVSKTDRFLEQHRLLRGRVRRTSPDAELRDGRRAVHQASTAVKLTRQKNAWALATSLKLAMLSPARS